MDNEALKQAFRNLHAKITRNVNPDSVIDELYSTNIISDKDYRNLRQTQSGTERCRELFSILHLSSHPETFVQLHAALRDEYPGIVSEIDRQLTSLPGQLQQLHVSQSTDGKFPFSTV